MSIVDFSGEVVYTIIIMNTNMIYAGIGARETPSEILTVMESISLNLGNAGWKLRSGGAIGADSAFQCGIKDLPKLKEKQEIYLPWNNFNYNLACDDIGVYVPTHHQFMKAEPLTRKYHSYYDRLTSKARNLMIRNAFQLLGINLDNPVAMVICYTENGKIKGGTGQALRISKDYNIPIYNLGNSECLSKIDEYVNQWCNKSEIVDF